VIAHCDAVLLIDVNSSMHELDKWRAELMGGWDVPGDFECNDGIVFGYQVHNAFPSLMPSLYLLCSVLFFSLVRELC
jgi:hypothetical protein